VPDLSLLLTISRLAAEPSYFTGLHKRLADRGIVAAVRAHDTPALFSWLVEILSLQGISDAAAFTFMDQHGRASWDDVARGLQNQSSCPKLKSHWHFHRCDFVRSRGICAEPTHYPACPLPSLPLRNGNLNRMAYGLFLFIRDICDGDLVGWIDQRLQAVPNPSSPDFPETAPVSSPSTAILHAPESRAGQRTRSEWEISACISQVGSVRAGLLPHFWQSGQRLAEQEGFGRFRGDRIKGLPKVRVLVLACRTASHQRP
jgi:hypothetical protein